MTTLAETGTRSLPGPAGVMGACHGSGTDAVTVLRILSTLSRDLRDPGITTAEVAHRTTAALTALPGVEEARLLRVPGNLEVSRGGSARPSPGPDTIPATAAGREARQRSRPCVSATITLGGRPWGLIEVRARTPRGVPPGLAEAITLAADQVALALREVEARDGVGQQAAFWTLVEALGLRLDAGMTLPEALYGEAATVMALVRGDGLVLSALGERLHLGCTPVEAQVLLELCRAGSRDPQLLDPSTPIPGLPGGTMAAVALLPMGEEESDGLVIIRRAAGRETPAPPFNDTERRDLLRLHRFIRERMALVYMRRRGLLGRLLTSVSRTLLVNPPSAAMSEALGTVAGAIGADLAAVMIEDTTPDAGRALSFQWVRPGIPDPTGAALMPRCAEDPSVRARLARGDVLRLPRLEAAETDLFPLADMLVGQGVRSLLGLPLLHRGRLAGCVAFATLVQTRPWSDWDVRFAGLSAEILGHGLLRERLEHAQAASEDRFRALFHQTNEPMYLLDHKAHLLDANRAAEEIAGFSCGELMALDLEAIVSVEGRPLRQPDLLARLNSLGPGEPAIMEVSQRRRDGHAVPLELTLRRFEHSGRALYLVSVLDISGRKAAEAAMRRRVSRDELMLAVAKRFVREDLEMATEAALADAGLFLSLQAVFVQEFPISGLAPTTRFAWHRDPDRTDLVSMVSALPKARLGLEVGRPWRWQGSLSEETAATGGEGDLMIRGAPVWVGHRSVAQVVMIRKVPGSTSAAIGCHDEQYSEDGRLLAFLCEMYAIALSRLRERTARADSEKRMEALARNLPGGVWRRLLTPDGQLRYTYFSGGVEGFSAVQTRAVLDDANTLLDTIHPDDRGGMLHSVHESAATLSNWVREFRVVDDSGAIRWMHASAKVSRLPDGTVVWDGITLDITARKRSEQALAESETRFRTAFNQAAEGMALISPAGRWLRVNQSLADLLGTDPASMVGTSLIRWVHRADWPALDALRRRAMRDSATVVETEARLDRRDGTSVWVRAKAAPVFGEDGHRLYWVAHVQDVSVQRATEDLLVRARDQAEATARAKSEFLAMMSHEIRTPLAGMIGLARLLQGGDVPSAQKRRAGRIESTGRLLLAMLDDILTLSKAEADGVDAARTPFSPAGLVSEVLGLLSANAEEKGLRLTLDLPPDLPTCLMGPVAPIRQVMFNLVGNAVKFTQRGRVVLRARRLSEEVATTSRHDRIWLAFEVEDTGIGIAPREHDTIFDAFNQGVNSRRNTPGRGSGVGLGLAICRRMVAAMGGQIGVDSQPGFGSRFWFTVPVDAAPTDSTAETTPMESEAEADEMANISWFDGGPDWHTMLPLTGPGAVSLQGRLSPDARPMVVVVDDDDINREVLEATLDDLGCTHAGFCTGSDLLESAMTGHLAPPDLILMDLNMPDLDGVETTRRLLALDKRWTRVPVLAVTAYDTTPPGASLDGGIRTVLRKPVDIDPLVRALDLWVPDWPGIGAPLLPRPADSKGAIPLPLQDDWDVPKACAATPSGATPALVHQETWSRRLAVLGRERLATRLGELRGIGAELVGWANGDSSLDTATACAVSHRIKGSAATLGAHALAAAANALDQAARADDVSPDVRAAFVAIWNSTLAVLEADLDGTSDAPSR